MANRTKLSRNKGKGIKEQEKSKGEETISENVEIPNPGSPSSHSGQQNEFPQNQQTKKASRTQMGGEHVDEKGEMSMKSMERYRGSCKLKITTCKW